MHVHWLREPLHQSSHLVPKHWPAGLLETAWLARGLNTWIGCHLPSGLHSLPLPVLALAESRAPAASVGRGQRHAELATVGAAGLTHRLR